MKTTNTEYSPKIDSSTSSVSTFFSEHTELIKDLKKIGELKEDEIEKAISSMFNSKGKYTSRTNPKDRHTSRPNPEPSNSKPYSKRPKTAIKIDKNEQPSVSEGNCDSIWPDPTKLRHTKRPSKSNLLDDMILLKPPFPRDPEEDSNSFEVEDIDLPEKSYKSRKAENKDNLSEDDLNGFISAFISTNEHIKGKKDLLY